MKFIGKRGIGTYSFKGDMTVIFNSEELTAFAKTAIEQGLIDPRDYLPKEGIKLVTGESATICSDPFYCMKSKAVKFYKGVKVFFGNSSFDSDHHILRSMIHEQYFPRWSDSLKILKERGYATYEKNEKGRIVNIRLLF